MNSKEIMEMAEDNFIHAYNRFPVVIDHGEGVYAYDVEGKKYLDCASGIAVLSLGYNNKKYNDALKAQIDKVTHTSNLFYNEPSAMAAKKIVEASGLSKVFFTNSGAEAIEGALKVAKKYAYNKNGEDNYEIIAMKSSFHGRTMGALALTGNENYQKPFGKMVPGVKYATFNDLDSVKELVNDKTCAIIIETLQGEGGIHPADPEFIQGIRKICDDNDILMICDEIQCGMGRLGELFAFDLYNVKPDITTMAKALGCGVPVGAFVVGEKCKDTIVPGDHGTTYGGNPFVCAAINAVFDIYKEDKIVENVQNVAPYLEEKLEELVQKKDTVLERRGKGFMQGLVLDTPVADVVKKAIANGALVISAGGNVLRMVPPLVFSKENVDELIEVLDKCL